ncbi:hypothetical protein ACHAWF_008265 [Thalassiosira exigua]
MIMRGSARIVGLVGLVLLPAPVGGYVAPIPPSRSRGAFANPSRPSPRAPRPIFPRAPSPRDLALSSSATGVQNATEARVDGESTPATTPPSSSSSSSPPAALGTSGDWSAYLDETKGLVYYFNPRTGESRWEPPADADFSGVQLKIGASRKAEMRGRLQKYLEDRLADSEAEFAGTAVERGSAKRGARTDRGGFEGKRKASFPVRKEGVKDVVAEHGSWRALTDEKRGRIYYHDEKTGESRWERPAGFPEFKLSASKRVALEERSKRYREWHEDSEKAEGGGRGAAVVPGSHGFEIGSEVTAPKSKGRNDGAASRNRGAGDAGFDQPQSLPIVQQGDWSAYFDVKTGLVFYFDEGTGKTSWDPPFDDFPRIVMEGGTPRVLDAGSGNISQERALGYFGVDEMAEAMAWEEAKRKERERKAAARAKESGAEGGGSAEMYQAAKEAEMERLERERAERERAESVEFAVQQQLEQERIEKERLERERLKKERLRAEEKRREDAAAQLAEREKRKREETAAKEEAAREREAAAKRAIQTKLDQERLDNERKANERKRTGGHADGRLNQPVLPAEDPSFTADAVEAMVAPFKTDTLYEVLRCSPDASRVELKRSYLSLAKETHPDALLQSGRVADDETERRFVAISQAWEVLGDPRERRRYDRELRAKGVSTRAGSLFENWVMGAAKAMDEALTKAEDDLHGGGEKRP